MFRSRSHPAYPRLADPSQNPSLKRGPRSGSSVGSSDSDSWRQGKRRRRDNLLPNASEKCFVQFQCENQLPVEGQAPTFATTSAQFNLFSRPGSSAVKTRRPNTKSEVKLAHERQRNHLSDIVRLRSSAFWELRQSITDNGEGLVRRMREYERSRSRHQVHHKAKEAEKKGRKKLCSRKKKVLVYTSDASEDEDILICSAESASHIPRGTFFGKRAASLNSMDVDMHHSDWTTTQNTRNRILSSSPDTRYPASPSTFGSDDDSTLVAEVADRFSLSHSECSRGSAPALSYSPGESASLSLVSLPLPSSTISESDHWEASPPSSSSASDKALAALNLAFANGAGSISDYSSVRQYQDIFQTQSYDNGDLWH